MNKLFQNCIELLNAISSLKLKMRKKFHGAFKYIKKLIIILSTRKYPPNENNIKTITESNISFLKLFSTNEFEIGELSNPHAEEPKEGSCAEISTWIDREAINYSTTDIPYKFVLILWDLKLHRIKVIDSKWIPNSILSRIKIFGLAILNIKNDQNNGPYFGHDFLCEIFLNLIILLWIMSVIVAT
ncbi:hypothetical protein Glove_117g203 [Diversispora epigaea]|uniref:Uncharacterized protein n=1 Tax=Diversispora epigaea TaxID=1348612 RepID=A0A397J567_9GLOM|nr:hypothetical protein Glove_117g203 [Diversispora epigaea]